MLIFHRLAIVAQRIGLYLGRCGVMHGELALADIVLAAQFKLHVRGIGDRVILVILPDGELAGRLAVFA